MMSVACGGEAAPAQPARPPPREVVALVVQVAHERSDDSFCQALEVGLARSGIAISSGPSQPADAVISCSTYASADDGFFRITANGESRQHFTVRVQVRSAQNVPVDQFIADFTGFRSSGPDEEAVNKVVVAFAYSPRIAAFAHIAKSTPAPATTEAPPIVTATAEAPPPARDPRDDAMWFAIDTVRCKIPARVEACIPVRNYLQRYPSGAHAQEASDVLAAAEPALEKLQKDEVAWQKSNHYECASRRTSDACVGVEAYDMQFASGLHSDEARRLLKAAGGK
jgi:hypothetical protein